MYPGGLEGGALVGDGAQHVEEIASRPCQPIEARHHQNVVLVQARYEARQLLAVRLGTAFLLLEDLGAGFGLQLGNLCRQVD
jgi:hypothetical protein